ncbi:MAG: PKD domain-containing protein [Pseudomonadota bacterium]|nr:PKD domain-containing protein [Pseudomonadota bacterium]
MSYTPVPHGGVNPRFSWSFGDGTGATAPARTPGATHTFAQPGRYTVTVTATDDVGANVVREFVQAVHHPLTATPPTVSMSIAYEGHGLVVFDSAGSQAFVTLESMGLFATARPHDRRRDGARPRWDRIHVICRSVRTVPGCSFRGSSRRLCRERRPPPRTRAVAVARSSWSIARRWRSPRRVVLQHSEATDTTAGGRGMPNYLGPAVIAPDGRSAWGPSKQDKIKRGTLRDGRHLTFETTPTSATRAKKASNLLILRSWGRKGRHYKVMFWLGHEGGVGGDLGG